MIETRLGSENIESRKSVGRTMEFVRRMEAMWEDPKIRAGAAAFTRTVLNAGISVADFVPGGLGEVLDVIATIGKTIKRAPGEKVDPSKVTIDLTPDVPTWVGWVAQAPEVVSGGAWPSYLIPTILQGTRDVPRIVEGVGQAIEMIRRESRDYSQNQPEIDAALEVFSQNG